jgi:hypothetical protein
VILIIIFASSFSLALIKSFDQQKEKVLQIFCRKMFLRKCKRGAHQVIEKNDDHLS